MFIPYRANGIYPSEAQIVIGSARRYNIDVLLESGIDNGYSTEVWAMRLCDVSIESTDFRCRTDVLARLTIYPNLALHRDYADPFFRDRLNRNPYTPLGIFIDGPKYEEAASICQDLMTKYGNVQFVAIHDCLEHEKPLFDCITFKKTFSVDNYQGAELDREAAEFNAKLGAVYPKGPGLVLVER